jgi:hypothetical protein
VLFVFNSVCHVLSAAVAAAADGSVIFWLLGQQEALVKVEGAHEIQINALAFHPAGHEMTTCELLLKLFLRSGAAGRIECMANKRFLCKDSLLSKAKCAHRGRVSSC